MKFKIAMNIWNFYKQDVDVCFTKVKGDKTGSLLGSRHKTGNQAVTA
jgi:hypothetical protein